MPRPVTAGVDGSAESKAAAAWAAREAVRRGLPLHVVHSWGWHPQLPAPLDIQARSRAERTVQEAETCLRTAHPGLVLTTAMTTEPAVPALLDCSESGQMLVLGSSGHSAVAGFLLGSIGQQVLARATGPVVMVRANEHADEDQEGKDIVVALAELGGAAQPLLRFAFTAADARGAAVRATHTWNVPSAIRHDAEALRLVEEDGGTADRAEKALSDALRPWRRTFPRLRVVQQVERGDPGEVLVRAVPDAALMVIGRKVRPAVLGTHIGPVAHDVLHHVAVPVAVIPHG
ncbi:universal stress protein [Streptomyces sp. NBC_01476]|uniref:universal stress protein n=1 Tax=Streptomyces sp. NBC_01476 TaxID=2903881 RepID=UPI002E32B02E|nr:universal stress protein [Streptomyces sp. NBC_01476]